MIAQRNEQVERELEKLVDVLVNVVPSLTEIRVFGSYNNGKWNPETSDIDVFVKTADENYSLYNPGDRPFLRILEREKIKEKITKYVDKQRFSIHLLTKGDISYIWDKGLRGPIGQNMKSGRLLYSSQGVAA